MSDEDEELETMFACDEDDHCVRPLILDTAVARLSKWRLLASVVCVVRKTYTLSRTLHVQLEYFLQVLNVTGLNGRI